MRKRKRQSPPRASRDCAGIVTANPADGPSAENTTRPPLAMGQTIEAPASWMSYERIDTAELAQRLSLPKSWVQDRVRTRAKDQIPHSKFGKYIRFDWGSPELAEWLSRRKVVSNSTVERAHIKEKTR
jgi:hypothetical protein